MKLYEDKYIVITGGAGFIGSCCVRHLNNLGMKNLVVVDDLGQSEKWKNLVEKRFVEIIPTEIFFSWLEDMEREIEAFIHMGACSDTTEKDASYLLENNTRFSMALAEYALAHGHRFIYASSAATYGDGSKGFSDDHDKLEELHPLNMYGYSKHLFDLWLKDENLLDKVVGLKFFNVFGPNEYHKGRMASVLTKMVPDALKTGKIQLFKSTEPSRFRDGDQVRDFIYVRDVVKMIGQFLTNDLNGIYNIGMGVPHTWNQVARAVIKAVERPVTIEYIEMPQDLIGKYQNYTCADMSKYRKAHLLPPAYSLEDGIVDYVRNYLLTGKYW